MGRTITQLAAAAQHDDFGATKYNAIALQAVADGIVEMVRQVSVPGISSTSTISLVAGTASYSLPADDIRILSVVDPVDDAILDPADIGFIDTAGDASGIPEVYAVFGTNLTFWPTPNLTRSLTLRYVKAPTTASGDDPTFIPDGYDRLLIAFARSELFAFEDDPQMSDFWRKKFDDGIARLRGDLGRINRSGTKQIPGQWRTTTRPRFNYPA